MSGWIPTWPPGCGAPTWFVRDKKSFVTLAELCADAYRAVAPARLVTLLDAS